MQRDSPRRKLLTLVAYGVGGVWSVGFVAQLAARTVKSLRINQETRKGNLCKSCSGKKTKGCEVCRGMGALDYKRHIKAKEEVLCICPVCHGSGRQKCANCLGVGVAL